MAFGRLVSIAGSTRDAPAAVRASTASARTSSLGGSRRASLLAVAVLAGCLHDVHRIGPIAPPPPERPATVRVLIFGDFGYRTIPQWLVARAMRRASDAEPFDLAIQLGDNIYMCGPDPTLPGAETCRFADDGVTVAPGATPPDDPLFRWNEGPLQGLRGRDGGPLPMYLVLGNHDVGWGGGQCAVQGLAEEVALRRRACLNVARRTPTWNMPARHYVIDRGPIRIIGLDTNVVVEDYAGFTLEDEIAFVREAIAPCGDERLCFLAGHHPPAAVRFGLGGRPAFDRRMARLLAAADGRARAFFAGHYHTLQHLWIDGLDVFVSGATAMAGFKGFRERTPALAQLRFATTAWGYATLEADARRYEVRFFDFMHEPLHCCASEDGGPCRSVDCR
jgi:hypothetical protein